MTDDVKVENSIADIKRFFTSEEQPLTTGEFAEFWNSLSEEEKDEFKSTPLS